MPIAPLFWILKTIRGFFFFSFYLLFFLNFFSFFRGMNSLVAVAEREKENYKIVKRSRRLDEVKGAISIFHISFNYIPEALIFG